MRFATPRWLGLHALLLASLLVLGRIGLWQLDKARDSGSWQNYGYAVQWWLFGGFAVFLWFKLVLDELDPSRIEDRQATTTPSTTPFPVPAPSAVAPADDEDDELASYNRHLAELAQRSER
ncbi:MAG: hypothetical protein H7323_10995 [Frankiales bacterium]|nr:hypothetical protein [Frankiales bacterium]